MFFVQKVARGRRPDFALIHWAPTIIIFFAFLGVTLWSWQEAKDRAAEDRQAELIHNVDQSRENIETKINSMESLLRAGASLFTTSEFVTRDEFKTFTDSFGFETRYPDVQRIGFAQIIPKGQLSEHEAQIKATGVDDYKVHPEGDRPIYTSIVYAKLRNEETNPSAAIGLDAYTDPVRKRAMEAALSSGDATITSVTYPPTGQDESPPTLFIYYPVFQNGQKTGTLEEAQGFIYIGILTSTLFNSLLSDLDQTKYGFRAFTNDPSPNSLLYKTGNFDDIDAEPESYSEELDIQVHNAKWTIELNSSPETGTPEIQSRPRDTLIFGIVLSTFIASFIYILLASRTRVLAFKEEGEIQSAKDELLALASHQLRTPATGVKQYVGMLREGFAGKLTSEQKGILDKAHESNERQLETINEMLSVARADTGRLPIEKKRQDIVPLVNDVIEEQLKIIESRRQKVSKRLPKTPVYADVDARYFRMAVENIINNASKYTPERGAIDIKLKTEKHNLVIKVDDTGVGISERHFPLLFKKFSRIPNDLTSQVSGSGIGLYLAKHVVEAHGGKLLFSSEAGVGSTFKIILQVSKK